MVLASDAVDCPVVVRPRKFNLNIFACAKVYSDTSRLFSRQKEMFESAIKACVAKIAKIDPFGRLCLSSG